MHQAPAGYADLTDLECMATIPVRVASRGSPPVASSAVASGGLPVACSVEAGTEALVKAEAILANLQQRFKKDQIYVSVWDFSTWVALDFPGDSCTIQRPVHTQAAADRLG